MSLSDRGRSPATTSKPIYTDLGVILFLSWKFSYLINELNAYY